MILHTESKGASGNMCSCGSMNPIHNHRETEVIMVRNEVGEQRLDAMTEAYMNLHGMDMSDDALWDQTREHVRELLEENLWETS